MKSFLRDSASKRVKGEVFKTLEKQIREAVYAAEDAIDGCVSQQAAAANSFMAKFKYPMKRLSLAKEVLSVREQIIKPVFDDAKLKFANLPILIADDHEDPLKDKVEQFRKISLSTKREIVGVDDEADKIIKYLCEESQELEVISIVGMPGLGKTTLALKIYRDSRIQREFPTIIWLYVSEEFSKKDVFLNILKEHIEKIIEKEKSKKEGQRKSREEVTQEMSSKREEELAQIVNEYLSTRKFLIIMDDMWTVDDWDQIEAALPKSNKVSKILITSRFENVGWRANHYREPHRLRPLMHHESWELLQVEVFGKVGRCPLELEEIGRLIAKRCHGSPLQIVVIGGILVEKLSSIRNTKREWERVSDCLSTYLNDDPQKRVENIILLSYNELPYELRDCFLYMGMFAEDFEISAWKLIRLWIAEGFIKKKWGKSLEEVGEELLEGLIRRNLVMVDKVKATGGVKTCRLHDMIREFCRNQAAFEKHNLFEEIRMSSDGVFQPQVSEIHNFRRLCIHSYVADLFRKKPKCPKARTFCCFSKEEIQFKDENIHGIITETFNMLRVIDANPIRFRRFPKAIANLVHLRYMSLSINQRDLPASISKLWNLQTIIIDSHSRRLEIKADISNMMQLRHLKANAAIILTKQGKGEAGENLQTLTALSPKCCTKQVFDKAPNLKTLGIRGILGALLDNKCLANLGRLEKLKLVNDVFPLPPSEMPLQGLPPPNGFPPNLRILTLSYTCLEWRHMSVLGMLNALEVLRLKDHAFIGESWEVVVGGFHSLESLYIGRTNLMFWTVSGEGDHFPKLRSLVLKNCEKLHEVPTSLVEKLDILDMKRVTKHAVASARKIEQEKQMKYRGQSTRRGGFKLVIAPGDE